jgi:hypothetical protein
MSCLKYGHIANKCWYKYDEDYISDQRHMVAATITYCTVDTNWYADSGAIGHITSELDKLAI